MDELEHKYEVQIEETEKKQNSPVAKYAHVIFAGGRPVALAGLSCSSQLKSISRKFSKHQ